jgi:hypothetical protein
VVAQAVGLDDEFEFRPEEVDFVAVDDFFREGERESNLPRQRKKQAFELLLGEDEGVAVEESPKWLDAWLTGIGIEFLAQVRRAD